jgi:hypothetical protein
MKFDSDVGGGSAVVAESNIVCAMLVDGSGNHGRSPLELRGQEEMLETSGTAIRLVL